MANAQPKRGQRRKGDWGSGNSNAKASQAAGQAAEAQSLSSAIVQVKTGAYTERKLPLALIMNDRLAAATAGARDPRGPWDAATQQGSRVRCNHSGVRIFKTSGITAVRQSALSGATVIRISSGPAPRTPHTANDDRPWGMAEGAARRIRVRDNSHAVDGNQDIAVAQPLLAREVFDPVDLECLGIQITGQTAREALRRVDVAQRGPRPTQFDAPGDNQEREQQETGLPETQATYYKTLCGRTPNAGVGGERSARERAFDICPAVAHVEYAHGFAVSGIGRSEHPPQAGPNLVGHAYPFRPSTTNSLDADSSN